MSNHRTPAFRILLPVLMLALLAVLSCKKDSSTAGTGQSLEFVKLVAEKDTIAVQELTKIKATVTGENVSYSWKCDNELGVLDGSGSEILFTICHAGKFKITCDIKDSNNHQASKDVYITTVE